MRCVSTVSYEVCFNGMSVRPINPKRGLCHGDPLSLYLFLFCIEGLSNSLDIAKEDGRIHGCRISLNALNITHLLSANDFFLFFNAAVEEATHVKNILNNYVVDSDR